MTSESIKIVLAMLFGLLTIITAVVVVNDLLNELKKSAKREAMVFESMDEARKFQRNCLAKGGSAIVREEVTGITIVCTGSR